MHLNKAALKGTTEYSNDYRKKLSKRTTNYVMLNKCLINMIKWSKKKITFDKQNLVLLPYLSLCRALSDSMKKRKEKTVSKLTQAVEIIETDHE